MKKYESPAIADFGSITECTFAVAGQQVGNVANATYDPETNLWSCNYTGDLTKEEKKGQKNWQAMDCDKFGEYSHPGTNSGS